MNIVIHSHDEFREALCQFVRDVLGLFGTGNEIQAKGTGFDMDVPGTTWRMQWSDVASGLDLSVIRNGGHNRSPWLRAARHYASGIDECVEGGSFARAAVCPAGHVKLHDRMCLLDRERHRWWLVGFLPGHGDELVHGKGMRADHWIGNLRAERAETGGGTRYRGLSPPACHSGGRCAGRGPGVCPVPGTAFDFGRKDRILRPEIPISVGVIQKSVYGAVEAKPVGARRFTSTTHERSVNPVGVIDECL